MVYCTSTDSNITQWKDLNVHNCSLSLKPSCLELSINQFSDSTPENSNDPEKICLSKYHIEEIPHKNKLISLFHINAWSLNKNFDDL